MSDCRIVLETPTGERLWINPRQVIKMIKNTQGRYFIFLINGETYEIARRVASELENFFQNV